MTSHPRSKSPPSKKHAHKHTHRWDNTPTHAHYKHFSGCVHHAVSRKYSQAHMHFIVVAHDCTAPYVNINGDLQDVSKPHWPAAIHNLLMQLKWGHKCYDMVVWPCEILGSFIGTFLCFFLRTAGDEGRISCFLSVFDNPPPPERFSISFSCCSHHYKVHFHITEIRHKSWFL